MRLPIECRVRQVECVEKAFVDLAELKKMDLAGVVSIILLLKNEVAPMNVPVS